MTGLIDRYLGIVLIAVILFYFFRDVTGTSQIIQSLSQFNTQALAALQGRGALTGASGF
jgi:hypothetical protein